MDMKIYKIWTEEFKGYYWDSMGVCVCDYAYDDVCDDVEDILDASTIRELERVNENAKENGGYPQRIVARRFTLVDLTEEDITALKQDVLDDDDDDLFKELDESYRIENYDNLYYVDGELYYYDDNTNKIYYCENDGMLSPVGYDPNDDDDDC